MRSRHGAGAAGSSRSLSLPHGRGARGAEDSQPRTSSTGWGGAWGSGNRLGATGPIPILRLCRENKRHRQRCRARLLPKGNKQTAATVPGPRRSWDGATIPQGSGHSVKGGCTDGKIWDSPLGSSCASVPVHATPDPAIPNSTPHPPSWDRPLCPGLAGHGKGPLKGQFSDHPWWVKPFRALPTPGEYLGKFPLLFLLEGVTPGAPALAG